MRTERLTNLTAGLQSFAEAVNAMGPSVEDATAALVEMAKASFDLLPEGQQRQIALDIGMKAHGYLPYRRYD